MGLSRLIGGLGAVVFTLLSTLSHAALFDRGGGLIYDDVLDITWLQDTNYALTNGDDNDGMMDWYEANDWAAGLSYYDAVRDVTYDDWRLPTLSPIDGSSVFDTIISNDGSTDQGYARTTTDGSDGGWRDGSGTPVSELGYMFYVNLANLGKCDPGSNDTCSIQDKDNWDYGNNFYTNFNTGLFTNFSQFNVDTGEPRSGSVGNYATGTDFNDNEAWNFHMKNGKQSLQAKGGGFNRLAAWAVRDGDVALAAIPVPASIWLFGSGLLGLMGLAKRKKVA